MAVWACFSGDYVQGLPCMSDADCGPQLSCSMEGLCGGLGDRALCGNGLLDVGEACDDGNTVDGDECTAICQRPGMCGNGDVEPGEDCDDGNTAEGDACTPACLLPRCGDGFLGPGEDCDDANDIGTDDCTPTCMLPACGDGFVNTPEEACDDGNATETDECTTLCTRSPEAPALDLSFAQVKQFEFHWEPVLGASWYELLEPADEGGEFVPVSGIILAESYSLTVPLYFRVNASYKLNACNSLRCQESAVVDATGSLAEAIGYFKASNTGDYDRFGEAFALSGDGNTLAVGAPGEQSSATGINGDDEDDNSYNNAGAVYVFTRTDDAWKQQAYVKAPNAGGDLFGTSVALSKDGTTLAVGAIGEGSSAEGAVYVFTRTDDAWEQEDYVNSGQGDEFGRSVALSEDGNTLAVGARGEGESAGAVYVFARTDEEWEQEAYVKASNAGKGDFFGASVALGGKGATLAVGAIGEESTATGINGNQDDNSAYDVGAVYIFARIDEKWEQEAYIKASNAGKGDSFGASVALSGEGTTLAVGVQDEDSHATGTNGHEGDNSAYGAGAVYVFTRTDDVWEQEAYVKASNVEKGDFFGGSVALSEDGNTLAVGARGEDSSATGIGDDEGDNSADDAGAVYVFTKDIGGWAQEAYVKASHTRGGDGFGTVSISADASVLAVGAPGDSYATVGVGNAPSMTAAFGSGAVYLY